MTPEEKRQEYYKEKSDLEIGIANSVRDFAVKHSINCTVTVGVEIESVNVGEPLNRITKYFSDVKVETV